MTTLYTCECGFSCKKSHYFINHKSVCKFENNDNFNKAISKVENSEIDSIKQWWNKYSDRIFMQKLYPIIGNYFNHYLIRFHYFIQPNQ